MEATAEGRVYFCFIVVSANSHSSRNAFQDAFCRMYGLPSHIEALPTMPGDGGRWSALHSWVMPTSSFLKFVMFSRMLSMLWMVFT
ncbi:uncharacterized protein LOC132059294 isoform X2 [Lycium ferocissimum]|uniref:uncharacterized protein LOC132059294 isoform X2 n=1 Tax=Lycium ferocissimum TaxID=112874 RepID=UPI0028151CBD|nr:uncharacterized protein LOC132059294 isoform X2 [Lycium ferocissimum]